MRSKCGVKLMDRKSTKDLMQMLHMNETIDQLARANSVRWYGHVLRKDKNNFLTMSLYFIVKVTMKGGRPKKTWQRAVVEQRRKVGLNVSDASNRSRWRLWVNTFSSKMRQIWPPQLFGDKIGLTKNGLPLHIYIYIYIHLYIYIYIYSTIVKNLTCSAVFPGEWLHGPVLYLICKI